MGEDGTCFQPIPIDGTVESFPLNSAARFTGRFREREFIDRNVLGLLPGSDPLLRSSCVILCAHYDHLGIGPSVRADSVYNGVVDNALGVAAVLEIARVFATAPIRLRRSLLFLLVTGEEKGLLGSQHYCSHPAVPLHRTIAAVNVDGLAIIDTFDDVTGIGVEFSTMRDHLEQVAAELGLSISPVPSLFLYLHPDNPVRDLSLSQLRGIFSGALDNWKDLGGPDLPVQVIHRQPNSGTYHFLRRHVLLEEPYGPASRNVANTQAVVQAVARTPGAIGYGGCAYGIGVVPHCSIDGVEPTPANVRSGAYPISRYLYLYSARPLRGRIKEFVDWVLSDAGQRIVAEVGYIPLWEVD